MTAKPTSIVGLALLLLLAVVVVGVAGCDRKLELAPATDFASYSEAFIERTHSLLPHLAVKLGRHEYDGVQTNYSADAIAIREAHFAEALAALGRFELTAVDERYERDLLLWYANSRLFSLQGTQLHQTNITSYFEAMSPDVYVSRDYSTPHVRLRALVKHTRNLPNLVRQLQTNLDIPLPKPHVEYALAYFAGMVEVYEDVIPQQFTSVVDVNLQQQLDDASLAAVHALRSLLVWLQEQQPQAKDNFRLGRELFQGLLLQVHQTPMTLEQFKMLGEQDLARNSQALKVACAELDAKLALKDCLAQVASYKPKPEKSAVARAREQLDELRQFVETQDLVTIPTADLVLVAASPRHRRDNIAYINLRGPYEPVEGPSTYYVAPVDPSWTAVEQLAYGPDEANLMLVSAHEVWPGHFLHGLHMLGASRQLRAVVRSNGFMEGWAHYAEELMMEAGFGQAEPMLRIGQLHNALLHNVRYLCSYGLHVEAITTQACEQMFVEQAFQNPAKSREQAARATYDPNYFSYTLHKLLIRQLRERVVSDQDSVEAWKTFHDQLLEFGAPPTPLAARYLAPSS